MSGKHEYEPPSDVERYQRLQQAAEKQINNVWEQHKRAAFLLASAIAVGGFL